MGPLSYNPVPGRSGGTYAYGIPNSDGTTLLLSILNGQLYANGVGVTGFVATPGEPCYFETINSNPVTVIILPSAASGAQGGYVYTPSTGHIANMVDTTFIAINRVPGLAFLNDWLYVMDVTGTIWNTQNQSDAFIWSGLNTIQANNYGDAGVCLTRQLTYVIAMKQWTTNIFYDAGAQIEGEGSPLGVVPDSVVPYGCMHPYTVAKIDETLLWVTTNQNMQPQVIVLDMLNPTIVSTPSVERVLKNFAAICGELPFPLDGYNPGIFSWGIKIAGHRLYGITIPVMNITMVFDLDQKLWYLWTDQNGNYWPYGYASGALPNYITGTRALRYMQEIDHGGVYPVDEMDTYPTDVGQIFNVDIYTPVTNFGTLRTKQLNMMYFDCDIHKGNRMFARCTDDDFQSWSNFREINLGLDRPELDDEGSFVRRAYHFRHAAALPFRIRSTGLDMDVGIL